MKRKSTMAVIVTLAGIILCYWDFYSNNHIQATSLSFLGECFLWSGSLYGCKLYIDYKLKK